jgi:hypothetical protein
VVFACGRLHRSVEKTWRVEAVESDVGRRGWVTREEAAPNALATKTWRRWVFPARSRFWHETGSERSASKNRWDGDAGKQVSSRHATTVLAMAGRARESDQWWHLLQRR